MTAQPVTGELGPKQLEAVNGPVDDIGPDMLTYVCAGCNRQYADHVHYFTGVKSVKCLWCTKFPKGAKR